MNSGGAILRRQNTGGDLVNVYDVVAEFEKRVAEYAGAPYGVAVNSCTNALLISMMYRRITGYDYESVQVPRRTYVGVPYSVINAGYKVTFVDKLWRGEYELSPLDVVDAARRFRSGMYRAGSLYCLSFHETKILSIGDGGMILTDDKKAYDALRQMRFDGRTPGVSVFDDNFTLPAIHANMKPDVACRGLMLMAGVKDHNEDLPGEYPDLSQHPIFTEVYR